MLRSARPEDVEDEEESVWLGAEVEGCVVRAREDRRGDIVRVHDEMGASVLLLMKVRCNKGCGKRREASS